MIIGISGKIHSGKDEIGKIIQYLFYLNSDIHNDNKLSYETFVKTDRTNNILIVSVVPEIKKFADSLKDIICILTGCTREQLEDEDFKNSKLPDEWIHEIEIYKGKAPFKWFSHIETRVLTYRELLQQLGINLFRNQLHENVWVNSLMSKYKKLLPYCAGQPDFDWVLQPNNKDYIYPNWIITDCRFPNEAKAIKDRGGIIIRVERINRELEMIKYMASTTGVGANLMDKIHKSNHPSETALDDYDFDYFIDNNSTIDELILRVKEILQIEKII